MDGERHGYEGVGVVAALYRFPVKSMRAEPVEEARLRWHGFAGDRRFAFVRGDDRTHFPWLTGRQVSPLLLYAPRFIDPSDPYRSPVVVRTPTGEELPVESPALLAELAAAYGRDVHLVQSNRGTFDSTAASLVTSGTIRALDEGIGRPLDDRRFRINVVVETHSRAPFEEEGWLEDLLVFGDRDDGAQMHGNNPIERCVMVNIDPETAERDHTVLRHVARERANQVGIYCSTARPGCVRVGDVVYRRASA